MALIYCLDIEAFVPVCFACTGLAVVKILLWRNELYSDRLSHRIGQRSKF
ncbi:hypothetical protein [Calothrix sp. NIES-2100]